MLSPFRLFRTRPDNRIRLSEDDTNYGNLLNTAVGSDGEDDEPTDFTNNNTNNTSENTNTSTSNQITLNQVPSPQEMNNAPTNSNDIFGDFSNFNNMSQNQPSNNFNQNNANNANNDSKYDAFNLFSNNEHIYGHLTNNNKRIGSTGDINSLTKNPFSPHNSKFQENKLYSSVSESQIFTKTNDNIGIIYYIFIYKA